MVDVNISVRSSESADPQPFLLWDTVWNPATHTLDWVVCPIGSTAEPQNGGGLQSLRPLDTAIRICLATWRRAETYDTLPSGNDPRGWWGDSIQLDDDLGPLGSRLWLLYRSVLNDAVATAAVGYAQEALQCLTKQGAVASFDITAEIDKPRGILALNIAGYSQSGQQIYNQKFARIWSLEFEGSNDLAPLNF